MEGQWNHPQIRKRKMAKEEFIDGKTGKIKKNIPLDSAKEEGGSLYLPLNQAGIVAPPVPIMYPLPLKIPLIDQSVCTGWILKGILKTTEPSSKSDISISTFAGHQWVLDFSANDLTGIFTTANHDCIAKIDSRSRRVAMKQSTHAPKHESSPPSKLIIREHNVWLIRKDKEDIQLTRKGTEEDSFLNEFRYSPNNATPLVFDPPGSSPERYPWFVVLPKIRFNPPSNSLTIQNRATPVLNAPDPF